MKKINFLLLKQFKNTESAQLCESTIRRSVLALTTQRPLWTLVQKKDLLKTL